VNRQKHRQEVRKRTNHLQRRSKKKAISLSKVRGARLNAEGGLTERGNSEGTEKGGAWTSKKEGSGCCERHYLGGRRTRGAEKAKDRDEQEKGKEVRSWRVASHLRTMSLVKLTP